MVLRFFLFAAIFMLASCTDLERDNPDDAGSINYVADITYGGETYKTVVIGEQTWMARNLNYDVPGNDTDVCYYDAPVNCANYGRLYNWATAMALPDSCNYRSSSCASQVGSKHQGICPSGWHIPSDAEWTKLTDFVGASTAGTKLKAASGWNKNGNGEDKFGFAALPGGSGIGITDSYYGAGNDGWWWSASENNISNAFIRKMECSDEFYSNEDVQRTDYPKNYLFSVRCVKD